MASDGIVHVIDDDDEVRRSLVFLLSTADFAVRAYPSALAFLDKLEGMQPGCVVTDVRMPGMSGTELQRRLKVVAPDLPVVVITGHGDVALAVEAMKAGAVDFIEKPFHDEALIGAVSAAFKRRTQTVDRAGEAIAAAEDLAQLSPRERQVLEGLLKGHANKTMAHDLGISHRTIEVHRANVMSKLGATSLADLVRKALVANGL
ncbi:MULTISPECIES: response regulator FixJ [unclassified Aureimonas]|uniref:response regulator FixJ n=1 Tax=unclassified Aureimonas TaxID=2615206 RepID=UPI0006F6E365|nr:MULTISPECIES: response regulator FixJ [unclassified Aureimonas]KQT55200.1 two-component system response regulator [Aureimonas sp. Leaf427]KQT70990.1 two-component system response regulator [Aureimonas sp. Leaf460]